MPNANCRRIAALCFLCMMPFWCALGQDALLTQSAPVRTADGVTVTGERAFVDFAWLKAVNPDAVGWLYQEETVFSQPVLQAATNDYYEKRGFDGTYVGSKGMAYLDAAASPAMDEGVVLLYGSGRENGSLEALNQYQKQAYYEAHPSLRLLTPSGDYQADVFAAVKTKRNSRPKWLPGQAEECFADWLTRVCENSAFAALPECLPKEGERLLVLTVNNADANCRLLFAALRPIRYKTTSEGNLNKIAMDRLPTQSGFRDVPGYGRRMVYAQNDTIWGSMRYESQMSSKFRHFDGGGCGPTAVAIAVANLVDTDDLPSIANYSANGLGTLFCPCSVNRVYCNRLHAPYQLSTPQEYLRYLPIAIADFAAGNNQWGVNSRPPESLGSNMRFLEPLCEAYGLSLTADVSMPEAMQLMQDHGNRGMVICCALRGSPFTNTSHFVVVAGADDTSFYVLDPLFRADYSDMNRSYTIEEVITPGVVRLKRENLHRVNLSLVGYVEKKQ